VTSQVVLSPSSPRHGSGLCAGGGCAVKARRADRAAACAFSGTPSALNTVCGRGDEPERESVTCWLPFLGYRAGTRPFLDTGSACMVGAVLAKSQESEAGSLHVLHGRPAFAHPGHGVGRWPGCGTAGSREFVDGDERSYGVSRGATGSVGPGDEISGPKQLMRSWPIYVDAYAVERSPGGQDVG
jgi:hypothetical protein